MYAEDIKIDINDHRAEKHWWMILYFMDSYEP